MLHLDDERALVLTTDFFTPIVDDPGFVSGGTRANTERMRDFVSLHPGIPAEVGVLLHDAQTSGGLLLAAKPAAAPALLGELLAQGLPAAIIGEVTMGKAGHIQVEPDRSA